MQGSSPLLTVKQVATALGIDERSVRDKLTIGTLKGTKKTVGNKDQWFVHQRDLDAELARRGLNAVHQQRQSDNWNQQSFEPPTSFQATPTIATASAVVSDAMPTPEVTSGPESTPELEITDVVAEVDEAPEVNDLTGLMRICKGN